MGIVKRILPLCVRRLLRSGIWVFGSFPSRVLFFNNQLRKATPVFIYQMGKVGSKTVEKSLLRTSYPGAVLHGHNFSLNHNNWKIRHLYHWALLKKRPLNVISLTREPIGRNVSAFFQTFERTTGVPYERANFSLEELRSIFLANYTHDKVLQWFDKNIRDNLHIDVYSTPFPECGFATYSHGNIRLLVMRSEIGDNEKINAIKDFLGLTDFQLVNTNIGEGKIYAETYQDFKKKIKLPSDYIAKMCESKYFNHFYSQVVIDATKMKWSES